MAIVSVNEHHISRPGRSLANGVKEYEKVFIVLTDDVEDAAEDILIATGVPRVNTSLYPGDTRARCKSVVPKGYGDERKTWLVTCTYSTARGLPNRSRSIRAWNRKPRISWSTHSVVETIVKDKDGAPIENSVNDRPDPGLTQEKHYPQVTIMRYERNYSIVKAMDYMDTVNETAMSIAGYPIAVEQALLTKYIGVEVEIDGDECWECTYEIMFKDAWTIEILDQGLYALNESGVKTRIQINGEDAVEPQMINGDGIVTTTPNYLTFRVHERKDFGPLGLP